jgi:ABC-type antimicrobial peptide transport system permease subunit
MSINVLERTREIGVMRTIGAIDMVIMQSVIIEGLVIGLIAWVLAIGLLFPISFLLLTINDGFGHDPEFHTAWYPALVRHCNRSFGFCQHYASASRSPADNQ